MRHNCNFCGKIQIACKNEKKNDRKKVNTKDRKHTHTHTHRKERKQCKKCVCWQKIEVTKRRQTKIISSI